MQVRGIEQRNQDVYVEQRNHDLSRRLVFVSKPINDFRSDDPPSSLLRQDRHAIALSRRSATGRKRATGKLGKNTTCRSASLCGELLGALQNVLIDIQGGTHVKIITHQTSDVN